MDTLQNGLTPQEALAFAESLISNARRRLVQ